MRKQPSVCIIILNYNGGKVVEKCVKSLLRITDYKNYKAIIVDNASTDNSVSLIKSKFKNVEILQNKENLGFIKGNNVGIKYALKKYKPKYIVLLNNDTQIIQSDWLKRMVEVAESNKKIGLVGCKLIFPNGRIQWAGRKKETNIFYLIFQTLSASLNPGVGMDEKESSFIEEVNTVSGACMMIRSELIKKTGLLDESLSPFFQEDVEYSFRAWKGGYKVFYVGTSTVVHLQSYSFEKEQITAKKLYLALRNSMIVSKKYFGIGKTLLIGVPAAFFASIFVRRDKTRPFTLTNLKLRDKPISKLLIFTRALKDAFRGIIV